MSGNQTWVAMGYIKGAFGVKGWVKVHASTEYVDGLLDYPEWRLIKDGEVKTVAVEVGHIADNELHVKLANIDNRDAAASLRGYTIQVSRNNFADTDDDEYYWVDLIGMQVVNRNGAALGEVVKLMETGAHDVLVVRGQYGEKLIPFVSHFVDDVNQSNRIIMVDWGLDY